MQTQQITLIPNLVWTSPYSMMHLQLLNPQPQVSQHRPHIRHHDGESRWPVKFTDDSLSKITSRSTTNKYPRHGVPSPTENAVREECKPGLVKTAKAHSAWQNENRSQLLSTPITDPENFGDEFPAVSKLANSMTSGRVRSSAGKPRKQNWLTSLISPSQSRRQYADVYGDEDGETHSGEARFRSSQLLRLRSDQDHQADVASRAREITSTNSSSSARDALDNVVARVASGEEKEITSKSASEQLRFSQLRPTTQKGDNRLRYSAIEVKSHFIP